MQKAHYLLYRSGSFRSSAHFEKSSHGYDIIGALKSHNVDVEWLIYDGILAGISKDIMHVNTDIDVRKYIVSDKSDPLYKSLRREMLKKGYRVMKWMYNKHVMVSCLIYYEFLKDIDIGELD